MPENLIIVKWISKQKNIAGMGVICRAILKGGAEIVQRLLT